MASLPLLLPTQSAAARAGGQLRLQAPLGSADERPPRLYKLNFPTYNGEGDPRPWLTRCNLFFLGPRTPATDKTWMASYHLTSVAALWYGHLEEKIGRPTWADFVARVSQLFCPPTHANPLDELISLSRIGSVAVWRSIPNSSSNSCPASTPSQMTRSATSSPIIWASH